MFDVSFFELLVIGVVALLVIGPERLPGAIRTGALWFGRFKRTLTETRAELEKHIGADEIRRTLHNEQVMASLEKLKESRAALERDLLDYQHKINAELNNSEVIDQPAEITQDLSDPDHPMAHLVEGEGTRAHDHDCAHHEVIDTHPVSPVNETPPIAHSDESATKPHISH